VNSSVSDRVTKTYRADEVKTRYVEVDGVRYAYRRLGAENPVDATPLMFIHRFRGTLDDWDPAFVDAMADTRDVILFSDAGLGSSTGELATSIEAKARNAAAFIRALGLSSVDVLGFSMGGFSCQEIALAEPDLVRKVVLVGSGPGGNPETDPPTDIVFPIALHAEYTFDDIRYLFFAEGREEETQAYIDRNAVRKDREPVVTPEGIQALMDCAIPFMSGDTKHFARLGEIRQPVLIVSGDRDNFFPVKNQWLLFRELPNAQLAVYPQAGHAPHQQHPETVAMQIERFLTHG
jgi:pimeloyl-ACP methyl ester carboxylesterase